LGSPPLPTPTKLAGGGGDQSVKEKEESRRLGKNQEAEKFSVGILMRRIIF
jgi:hypothetical protein